RQDAVQTLLDNPASLEQLRGQLAQVRDLERTLGRLSGGAGNGRDLAALRLALEQLPGLKRVLHELRDARPRAPLPGADDGAHTAHDAPSLLPPAVKEEFQGNGPSVD